ncbi:MAG: hypothetical protein ACKO8U_05910 [Pirellula sp.]
MRDASAYLSESVVHVYLYMHDQVVAHSQTHISRQPQWQLLDDENKEHRDGKSEETLRQSNP